MQIHSGFLECQYINTKMFWRTRYLSDCFWIDPVFLWAIQAISGANEIKGSDRSCPYSMFYGEPLRIWSFQWRSVVVEGTREEFFLSNQVLNLCATQGRIEGWDVMKTLYWRSVNERMPADHAWSTIIGTDEMNEMSGIMVGWNFR